MLDASKIYAFTITFGTQTDTLDLEGLAVAQSDVRPTVADVEAVWEVMAHESTHIMQACTGSTAIADELMPRTFRELRTMAPHYAKLIDGSYPVNDQRLEAEAFWMELQTPPSVIGLFRNLCAAGLPKP
jgi:hypothetical protein